MSYKTRYLQSCFNTITYELHNLLRFLRKEVSKNKRKSYRLGKQEKIHLIQATAHLKAALNLINKFKGIEN